MVIADYIIEHVAEETGITKKLIKSKYRHQEIVDAKQIVVFALTYLGFTQKFIGNQLNYRDHSTVNHLINKRCFNSHENRLRATQAIKSYLDMALVENARLRANMKANLSQTKNENF
jgi:chromosomal replication initiation ATPase DnaA